MTDGREQGSARQMAESQFSELRNMRVLLEAAIGKVLDEVDRHIEELRADRG